MSASRPVDDAAARFKALGEKKDGVGWSVCSDCGDEFLRTERGRCGDCLAVWSQGDAMRTRALRRAGSESYKRRWAWLND